MKVTYVTLKPLLLVLALATCAPTGWVQSQAQAGDLVLGAADGVSENKVPEPAQSANYVRPDPAADKAARDPKLAARREEMIAICEDNRGVDCAKQTDTELGAEQLQLGGVRHLAPTPKR